MQLANLFLQKIDRKIRIRQKTRVILLNVLLIFFSLIFLLGLLSEKYIKEKNHKIILNKIQKTTSTVYLPIIEVEAKSFVVYDIKNNKIILSKNSRELLPLASLTKIQTAYIFANRHDLKETITIPTLGINHLYDFTLKKGDIWSVSELIRLMLTISSNDAAESLARSDTLGRDGFIQLMNAHVRASSSFIFTSPSGLDEGETIGGMGSALDLALLLRDFYQSYPALFETTAKTKISVTIEGKKYSGVPNTNQEVETYRGVVGSKTGYTDKAGGNLAVIYDIGLGEPVAVVILGSTKDGRFEDMKTLISYVNSFHNELLEDVK